tara:strand:+ start:162 stop:953 length:792 start_codon:yes stop_codon:yes gene_type:complete
LELKKISIVTISFNQAEFLSQTINSILDQDYENLEYIIVDAGSTDGSREIIESFANRISKIIFEKDNGPADGLNKGFHLASGEIFGYLNSDDILYPGVLRKVGKEFLKTKVDVLSAHGHIINEQNEKIKRIFSHNFDLKQYCLKNCVVIQPSTFFKASLFKKSKGFNVQNKIAWDGELMLDLSKLGANFIVKNQFWSGFRLYSNSISGNEEYSKKLKEDYLRLSKKHGIKTPGFLLSKLFWMLNWFSQPSVLFQRLLSIFISK